MPKLGVNVDHIATLRQARGEGVPSLEEAALICQRAGAHSIVTHLREDRRHIQEDDLWNIRRVIRIRYNLEMSVNSQIVRVACRFKPDQATLVPERRKEKTTESGLDLMSHRPKIEKAITSLHKAKVPISFFIDPDVKEARQAAMWGAEAVEIHTGSYAGSRGKRECDRELGRIQRTLHEALHLGLVVHAGHGLNYQNVKAIAKMKGFTEFNIGFSIVARSVVVGLGQAVREMLVLLR